MIYGNHDIVKKSPDIVKKYFYNYYDKITKQNEDLLNNLNVQESLVLDYKGYDIFLLHGHQVDFLNSAIWLLPRFLVRNVWKTFENVGLKAPTKVGKNYKVTNKVEKTLEEWSIKNNKILIAGHTHRPIFPKVGQSLYFNDGSCIHPNGITCLEIENGNITLLIWEFDIDKNESISVKRKVLEGNIPINKFYK